MSFDVAARYVPWFPRVTQPKTYDGINMILHTQGCVVFDPGTRNVILEVPPSKKMRSIPWPGKTSLLVHPFSTTWIQGSDDSSPNQMAFMRYVDFITDGLLTFTSAASYINDKVVFEYATPVSPTIKYQACLIEDRSLLNPAKLPLEGQTSSASLGATPIVMWTPTGPGIRFVRVEVSWATGGHNVPLLFKMRFYNGADIMLTTGFRCVSTVGVTAGQLLQSYIVELPDDLTSVDVACNDIGTAANVQAWFQGFSQDSFARLEMAEEPSIEMRLDALNRQMNASPLRDPAVLGGKATLL
jgi:hypothetical protein